MMIYLRQQWEHKQSIPTLQWQFNAGFTSERPDTDEDEEPNEELWEDQSFEKYYSSHDGEETSPPSDSEDEENDVSRPEIYVTRSGRKSKPPERLIYDANACLIRSNEHEDNETWSEQNLLGYKASTDPDTMYHHQAMKQPDREKFQEAMKKECEAHYKEGNYRLVKRSELPEGATLLSSVWQMKKKIKPSTGEISKYKARMNVDGSQMIKGLHYEATYATVVQWASIRFFISLAILSNWQPDN
jgi:hypothetical protein